LRFNGCADYGLTVKEWIESHGADGSNLTVSIHQFPIALGASAIRNQYHTLNNIGTFSLAKKGKLVLN